MSIPVWIDTDTGVDDAMALMGAVALANRGLIDLVGVSAVHGNTTLSNTFQNARNVLAFLGRSDIPVYRGKSAPMIKDAEFAEHVHGANGLNDVQLPASLATEETMDAIDALYREALRQQGKLQLILIGPDTNAAYAFLKYPDLKNLIERILIMGGAEVGGNITAAAEFNIWADPQAAQIIFKSGVPIVMCGLDVTMKSGLNCEEIGRIKSDTESPACRLFTMLMNSGHGPYHESRQTNLVIHDMCPVFYVVYPELFEGEQAGVFVETQAELTFGQTVVDRDTDIKFPVKNALVILDLDRTAYAERVIELLKEIR